MQKVLLSIGYVLIGGIAILEAVRRISYAVGDVSKICPATPKVLDCSGAVLSATIDAFVIMAICSLIVHTMTTKSA